MASVTNNSMSKEIIINKGRSIEAVHIGMNQWQDDQRSNGSGNHISPFIPIISSVIGNTEYEKGTTSSIVSTSIGSLSMVVPTGVTPSQDRISIELEGDHLWKEFHQYSNEMVVTKPGRRMFPTLRFRVTGLDPNATYGFYVVFFPADNYRYKFQHGRWSVNGHGDSHGSISIFDSVYQHPDSPANGLMWMNQPVSFHRIKLTNCAKSRGNMVLLSSMRKYQPRLIVVKLHDDRLSYPFRIVAEFYPPEMQFIAVTAYQNSLITELKVKYNPFAKGFRQHCSQTTDADQGKQQEKEKVKENEKMNEKEKEREKEEKFPKKRSYADHEWIPDLIGSEPDQKQLRMEGSMTPPAQREFIPGNITTRISPHVYTAPPSQGWRLIAPPAFYFPVDVASIPGPNNGLYYQAPMGQSSLRPMPSPSFRPMMTLPSMFHVPPSYASLATPSPAVSLPGIDTFGPRFPSHSMGLNDGTTSGIRFTMY